VWGASAHKGSRDAASGIPTALVRTPQLRYAFIVTMQFYSKEQYSVTGMDHKRYT
jgi:hypothetical protein